MDPTDRRLRARMAALTLHSRVDSREHTAPARAGFMARFDREVDPESVLAPEERTRRAARARRAWMVRLALRSAQARRR